MKLRNILGAFLIAASVFVASPVMAAGGPCPAGSLKSSYTNSIAECNVSKDNSLLPTITKIIDVVIGVLGLVAVFVIVLGGVQFVTASGDPTKVKKAKDAILYGVIGLVIAILAYPIVNFVLSSISAGK
jgi:hypothetical protein